MYLTIFVCPVGLKEGFGPVKYFGVFHVSGPTDSRQVPVVCARTHYGHLTSVSWSETWKTLAIYCYEKTLNIKTHNSNCVMKILQYTANVFHVSDQLTHVR